MLRRMHFSVLQQGVFCGPCILTTLPEHSVACLVWLLLLPLQLDEVVSEVDAVKIE